MIKKLGLLVFGLGLLMGCSSDDGGSSSNAFNPDDYVYYIKGKVNGEDFLYGQLASATVLDYSQPDYGNSITSNCAFNPTGGGVNYTSGVYPSLENEARPNMYFDFVRFYLCAADFDNNPALTFNDSFPEGSYATAVSNNHNTGTTGAVSLHYRSDSTNNMIFYNSLGDNQSNNSFEITSSVNANQTLGQQVLRRSQLINGSFNYTLYNSNDLTDVIEITDGEFKLFVVFD